MSAAGAAVPWRSVAPRPHGRRRRIGCGSTVGWSRRSPPSRQATPAPPAPRGRFGPQAQVRASAPGMRRSFRARPGRDHADRPPPASPFPGTVRSGRTARSTLPTRAPAILCRRALARRSCRPSAGKPPHPFAGKPPHPRWSDPARSRTVGATRKRHVPVPQTRIARPVASLRAAARSRPSGPPARSGRRISPAAGPRVRDRGPNDRALRRPTRRADA